MVAGFTRLTIYPAQTPFFSDLLRQVHRLRRQIFVDQKDWDLSVADDGGEYDEFDNKEAVYIVLLQEHGICAAARLNPARNTLLTQKFAWIMDQPLSLPAKTLECSRMIVDPELAKKEQRIWTARLLWACGQAGLAQGTDRFCSLVDPMIERILRRAGGQPRRLGRPCKAEDGSEVLAVELPGDVAAVARVGFVGGVDRQQTEA